jgi:lipopolysaccharide/colanic/teichoic acid biosynthesis glycosyltransferase
MGSWIIIISAESLKRMADIFLEHFGTICTSTLKTLIKINILLTQRGRGVN